MFLTLFLSLRQAKIPVTLTEYLTLLKGVEQGLAQFHVESFYHLARICLIKDERFLDRFDQVFGQVFRGLTPAEGNDQDPDLGTIPADWLRAMAEKLLTPEELAQIQALGGFEELMETLLKRLAEQQDRHQGGSK